MCVRERESVSSFAHPPLNLIYGLSEKKKKGVIIILIFMYSSPTFYAVVFFYPFAF